MTVNRTRITALVMWVIAFATMLGVAVSHLFYSPRAVHLHAGRPDPEVRFLLPLPVEELARIEVIYNDTLHRFEQKMTGRWQAAAHAHSHDKDQHAHTHDDHKHSDHTHNGHTHDDHTHNDHGHDDHGHDDHEHKANPVSEQAIRDAVATFGRTRLERRLENALDLEAYGLANPDMIVHVFAPYNMQPLVRYSFGDRAPDGISRYVYELRQKQIHTVADYQFENLLRLIGEKSGPLLSGSQN